MIIDDQIGVTAEFFSNDEITAVAHAEWDSACANHVEWLHWLPHLVSFIIASIIIISYGKIPWNHDVDMISQFLWWKTKAQELIYSY